MKNKVIESIKDLKKRPILSTNLQYFAESNDQGSDSDGSDDSAGSDSDADDGDDDDNDTSNTGGKNVKTFTQQEMNSIATREKKQGKNAILKSLGVKTEAEAKAMLDAYRKITDATKTPEQKTDDAQKDADNNLARALAAEAKLSAITLGVKTDCVDDAIAIATMKTASDDSDVETVLKEMQKDKKYAGFFSSSSDESYEDEDKLQKSNKKGTGSSVSHGSGSTDKPGDFGRNLAKMNNKAKTKSSYFTKN
jgi:hypothetical protein